MRLDDIDYDLPVRLIAQSPIEPRDAARLLVDTGTGVPLDRHVRDLPDILRAGDVLVVNDTRVVPARLHLQRRTGGAVEVLLLESFDDRRTEWDALIRPARKLRTGEVLVDGDGGEVLVIGDRGVAGDTMHVSFLVDDVTTYLAQTGEMPLPPYITQALDDPDRYQTVFARDARSAAAPTAGLHFTPALLAELGRIGVQMVSLELVVGLDTFQPVSAPNPLDHVIHTERYRVPDATIDAVADARRVVAVGTTATRALETAVSTGRLSGRSDLFITPGYDFRAVDLMMTNFHMPRTTLLLMVEAFVGRRWRDIYAHAIAAGYRMLSFGDASLLTCTTSARSRRS
jgi:S-adenosylmethionine:tRNA ribosyltransferase-isomerase